MISFQLVLLAIIQGLTEFIPVSSSAHLLIFNQFFNQPLDFEMIVFLNFGTLLALIVFNARFIWSLKAKSQLIKQLFWGTLPAFLIGYFIYDFLKALSSNLTLIWLALVIVGLAMLFTPKLVLKNHLSQLDLPRAFLIGWAQSLAFIPGVSRSGITILTGLWLKLSYSLALRFSFLLAIPVVAGALIRVWLTAPGWQLLTANWSLFWFLNGLSFLTGLLAIAFLTKIFKIQSLRFFGIYRLILAGLLILVVF